ncbi:hypothetical protein STCU_11926 [Strigomonas culicis]|uniref:Uncharacterized protein n=1 Tax=Strigomonas culicis TaxID=28005 RepID=S9ULL5_9TRYP|nr:hypothetical protein STCU_11926 [Strigomonas culicis]|eukprot:EPY15566.1 hypothetical protein STCU_11926 [Strigomonas culicis]
MTLQRKGTKRGRRGNKKTWCHAGARQPFIWRCPSGTGPKRTASSSPPPRGSPRRHPSALTARHTIEPAGMGRVGHSTESTIFASRQEERQRREPRVAAQHLV